MAKIYRESNNESVVIPDRIAKIVLGVSELKLRKTLCLASGTERISDFLHENLHEGVLTLSPEKTISGLRHLLRPASKKKGDHLTAELRRLLIPHRSSLKKIRDMAKAISRKKKKEEKEDSLLFSWSSPRGVS
jgi:hypothetical protein